MSEEPLGDVPFYAQIGGEETIRAIVHGFYANVARTPDLRAIYPEEDLGPAEERFRLFLAQYWGGPSTYSEQRGHPRLRMRHAPYAITPHLRDLWLACFLPALDEARAVGSLDEAQYERFRIYIEGAADFMVNTPG